MVVCYLELVTRTSCQSMCWTKLFSTCGQAAERGHEEEARILVFPSKVLLFLSLGSYFLKLLLPLLAHWVVTESLTQRLGDLYETYPGKFLIK